METYRGVMIHRARTRGETRGSGWRYALAAIVALVLVFQNVATLQAEDPAQDPGNPGGAEDRRLVLIEVLIFEIETSKGSEIGVDWVYSRGVRGQEHGSAVHEVSLRTLRFTQDELVTFPTPDTGPSPGSTIRPGTSVLGVPHPLAGLTVEGDFIIGDHATVFGRVRALLDKGDARNVSRPIVVVENNQEAKIHVGGEIPYQALQFDNRGRAFLAVEFEEVGVDLTITPTILPGDMVRLKLDPVKVSALTRTENIRGVDLPFFGSREERTTVVVPHGLTYKIGGLRAKRTREAIRRIPILGRIPVLGALFRTTELSTEETDLTILITPTILRRGQQVPLPAEFQRADEARRKIEEEL
jgi:general secretion pathway protein D